MTQTATITVNPVPTISSFVAAPPTITVGGSSMLTAVFANGTGVITPGNIAVTSGTGGEREPDGDYDLYADGDSDCGADTAITQTATVTVNPVQTTRRSPVSLPVRRRPSRLETAPSLTASFCGRHGRYHAGQYRCHSRVAVSVSPATTTSYTLTVTPAVGHDHGGLDRHR